MCERPLFTNLVTYLVTILSSVCPGITESLATPLVAEVWIWSIELCTLSNLHSKEMLVETMLAKLCESYKTTTTTIYFCQCWRAWGHCFFVEMLLSTSSIKHYNPLRPAFKTKLSGLYKLSQKLCVIKFQQNIMIANLIHSTKYKLLQLLQFTPYPWIFFCNLAVCGVITYKCSWQLSLKNHNLVLK